MRAILPLLLVLGCLPPAVRPITPAVAVDSTVQVEVSVGEELVSVGTAWVVHSSSFSEVVTAGHVCSEPGAAYMLVERDNTRHPAVILRTSSEPDLCLLLTTAELPALPIATRDPAYGAAITYVGAPYGLWGDGAAPIFSGHYAGGSFITAPTGPGASGSAVWGPGGVIGVLVAVDRRFHHIVYIVPRAALLEFLRGGVVGSRRAHNPERAGSTPAPATTP